MTKAGTNPLFDRPVSKDLFTWKPLRILALYRLIVSIAITILFGLFNLDKEFFTSDPTLFLSVCYFYVVFACLFLLLAYRRSPPFKFQLAAEAIADIFFIVLMIYARGSVGATLGSLMIISVSGSSILMSRRMAMAYVSFISLVLLTLAGLTYLDNKADSATFTNIGTLCIGLFITALVSNTLSRYAQEYELLAKKRGIDLLNLEQLNEYIVAQLQSGVLALNHQKIIRLANTAACDMLHATRNEMVGKTLEQVCPLLNQALDRWTASPLSLMPAITLHHQQVFLNFMPIGSQGAHGTLILLENENEVNLRIQDAKLASLGRLTAGIAHEIRNPLGAISHATQLLAESEELNDENRRLTEIITHQSARLNTLIKNVLDLAKRNKPHQSDIHLQTLLSRFIDTFSCQHPLSPNQIRLLHCPPELSVKMDSSHLDQILWIVCDNAFKHAQNDTIEVTLEAGNGSDLNICWLRVCDNGHVPVDAQQAEKIFEPFYTTHGQGTGLGLYLAREICENNGARIVLDQTDSTGTCFKLLLQRTVPNAYET
jgi:two-component system sensor histidine kinase PilS (NtrC family)